MRKTTGAYARFGMQLVIALLQIVLVFAVYQLINTFIQISLVPMYQLYLELPGFEEQAIQMWIFIEAFRFLNNAIVIFGIGHVIWRILDNLITWRVTEEELTPETRCPKCGAPAKGQKYCNQCGTKLANE